MPGILCPRERGTDNAEIKTSTKGLPKSDVGWEESRKSKETEGSLPVPRKISLRHTGTHETKAD